MSFNDESMQYEKNTVFVFEITIKKDQSEDYQVGQIFHTFVINDNDDDACDLLYNKYNRYGLEFDFRIVDFIRPSDMFYPIILSN